MQVLKLKLTLKARLKLNDDNTEKVFQQLRFCARFQDYVTHQEIHKYSMTVFLTIESKLDRHKHVGKINNEKVSTFCAKNHQKDFEISRKSLILKSFCFFNKEESLFNIACLNWWSIEIFIPSGTS